MKRSALISVRDAASVFKTSMIPSKKQKHENKAKRREHGGFKPKKLGVTFLRLGPKISLIVLMQRDRLCFYKTYELKNYITSKGRYHIKMTPT